MVIAIRLGEITADKSWSLGWGGCREASSLTQENCLLNKAEGGNAGQLILVRPRHVKRMEAEMVAIGTRNVSKPLSKRPIGRPKDTI